MTEEKKTEEQLRHEIRRKFGFSEEREKERIDGVLQIEKDKFQAIQQKKKYRDEVDKLKSSDPIRENKGGESQKGETGKEPNYSLKDIRALNDIADDDIDDFLDLSRKFGLSPAEAKANKDVQVILKSRAEERKTASATNTGGSKRGSSKVSGESLLEKALSTNQLPESDEDMRKLTEARLGIKKA